VKIKPDDKKIRSFTKYYWKQGRKVLYANSSVLVNMVGNVSLDEIKGRAENILDSVILRDYLTDLWVTTGSWFARDMSSRLMTRQNKDAWEESYILYLQDRLRVKASRIARTEANLINQLIDLINQEGFREGWSIDRITAKIKSEMTKQLRVIHDWEAERIARTEVIGAANKGSFDGASVAGGLKKGWLTSGLKGTRETHQFYESLEFKPMDYEYAPGLRHPGDPNGSAEEIINCRCTIIYSTE